MDPPQASNSTLPGYVVIQKLTCASAGPFPTSITGTGPWTVTVSLATRATNKNFSMSYGGTVASSKVTAPSIATAYEFTAQADFGPAPASREPTCRHGQCAVRASRGQRASEHGCCRSDELVHRQRPGLEEQRRHEVPGNRSSHLERRRRDAAADYTFTAGDAGTHTFTPGATLITTGSRTLTATDTSNAAINGSQTVTVSRVATHFVVGGLANPSTAGVAQSLTVVAKDAFNNTASGYTGTVHFTSSDGAATLPANYGFIAGDAGSHSFSVTLRTVGSQDVTATDTANASVTGLQTVTVSPGAATHFLGECAGIGDGGIAQSVSVTAKDSSNNTATGYTGTVHFTSSDGAAVRLRTTRTPAATRVVTASRRRSRQPARGR